MRYQFQSYQNFSYKWSTKCYTSVNGNGVAIDYIRRQLRLQCLWSII